MNIKFGYSTEKTKKIQEIVGTKTDGIYGKKTLEAVRKYQKHLSELGVYEGPANGLWDAATEAAHKKYTGKPAEKERQEPFGKEDLWRLGRGGDFEKRDQVAFIAQKGATLSSLVREMNNFLRARGIDYEYNVREWKDWIVGPEKGDVEGEPVPKLPNLIGIGNILWVKGPIVEAIKERVEKGPERYKEIIEKHNTCGVPLAAVYAIIEIESSWIEKPRPRYEKSVEALVRKGNLVKYFPGKRALREVSEEEMGAACSSYGLMQIVYTTAYDRGFRGRPKDLSKVEVNIKWGMRELCRQYLRYGKDLDKMAAAYNRGKVLCDEYGRFVNIGYVRKFKRALKKYQ